MEKYIKIVILAFGGLLASGCVAYDDSFTSTVFVDEPGANPQSNLYCFDKWLEDNYLKPYNLDFRYKMEDAASDLSYNLVPAELEKSKQLAILVKYLWFEAYSEAVNPEFLKYYGPRMIRLIGSGAYNPYLGTVVLGTAEGGIQVTLYECNRMDAQNVEMLNEYYFKTMHHEFAHILHQQKTYPKEFETYSAGYYDPSFWQERTASQAASLGFASPYGSSQPREDFVEIIANYIVRSDEWWNILFDMASKPGINQAGEETPDPLDGKAILIAKIEIGRKWLKESWDIDLDLLRANVRERQLHIAEAIEKGYEDINKYR